VRPGENGGRGPAEAQTEAGPAGDLFESTVRLVEELVSSVWQQIEIYKDRRRLSVRRTIIEAAVGAGLAVGAIVWLCAAALATLRGLCGGLAVLFGGRVWAGDLVGGSLALALVICALLVATSLMSRADLRRLEAKYDRLREDQDQGQDGRGTARPEGSRSASADADRDAALR
jgi:hypothetical protein